MYKVIVFDLDDTLILEKDYVYSGFRAVSVHLEQVFQIHQDKLYDKLIQLFSIDSSNVFNRLLDAFDIDYCKHDILKLVEIYRQHKPTISLQPDGKLILDTLRNKGFKIGLITDGYAVTQKQKIKVLKLEEKMDYIIVTDEIGREFWKPHRRAFDIMKDHFNISFNEMVYIGDNPQKDFHIGGHTEILTIRIKRNGIYKSEEYLDNIREKKSISNLMEILDIIEK